MKTKALMALLTAFCMVFLVGAVSATTDLVDSVSVEFNDIELADGYGHVNSVAGFSGDVVPVTVWFNANIDASDVKIRAEIYGGRDDFRDTTSRFVIVEDSQYKKVLKLELPSSLKDITKDLTLNVRIYDADHSTDDFEAEYEIRMQREAYEFDLISVDYSLVASAGDLVPVAVVVKNTGFERSDDTFVTVRIPSLGISSRGYAGDLVPDEDNCINCNDNDEDSVQKVVYLRIPESAKSGIYDLEVEASNSDSSANVRREIKIVGSAIGNIFAAVNSQDIRAGETKTYDLVLVNSGNDVKVYTFAPVSGSAISVNVPSVVTVGPKSSETVGIDVTVANGAEEGLYTFSVNVNDEPVVMGANVVGDGANVAPLIWTIVLAVIFVALIVVVIYLLTKKEKHIEEVETSYY